MFNNKNQSSKQLTEMYFQEDETSNRKYNNPIPKNVLQKSFTCQILEVSAFYEQRQTPTLYAEMLSRKKKNVDLIWGKFGQQKAKIS